MKRRMKYEPFFYLASGVSLGLGQPAGTLFWIAARPGDERTRRPWTWWAAGLLFSVLLVGVVVPVGSHLTGRPMSNASNALLELIPYALTILAMTLVGMGIAARADPDLPFWTRVFILGSALPAALLFWPYELALTLAIASIPLLRRRARGPET